MSSEYKVQYFSGDRKCWVDNDSNDLPIENHASYLNSWLKVLKEEPNFIVTAASAAQKATDYIATKLTSWDIHAETSASLSDLMSYDPEGQYAA